MPFCPFYFGASLLKPNTRKKGTLVIFGSLRNLGIRNPKKEVFLRVQVGPLVEPEEHSTPPSLNPKKQ